MTQDLPDAEPNQREDTADVSAMNAALVADLAEEHLADGNAASPVAIDLPEPELKFSNFPSLDPSDLAVDENGAVTVVGADDGTPIEIVGDGIVDAIDRAASPSTEVEEHSGNGIATLEAAPEDFPPTEVVAEDDAPQVADDEASDNDRPDAEPLDEDGATTTTEATGDDLEPAATETANDDRIEASTDPDEINAADAAVETTPIAPAPEQLLRVEKLIVAIREDGHLAATTDPLGLRPTRDDHLSAEMFGIEPSTTEHEASHLAGSEDGSHVWLTGPTISASLDRLRELYCGNVGYEFGHVHDVEERNWLYNHVESQASVSVMSDEQRLATLELLSRAEGFEQYLHTTFPGRRWYSLEGLDSLMVLIDQIVLHSAFDLGQIVMGMTHRGRLNVLAHILDQPYDDVLSGFLEGRFAHLSALEASGWMTDVKYHLGSRVGLDVNRDGMTDIVLRLLPNASHLELVAPGVLGAVRAIQDDDDSDDPHLSAMALLIHGDAAFAGQGIVSETLNLMNLEGYSVGGTIHVIANNQLGFTTEPHEAFSGAYASDVARGYEIPVVHVNADDVEACATVAKMAVSYRARFRKDFVIDLVGYRRHGHNENDEPSITQPAIYRRVEEMPTVRQKWADELIAQELVTPEEAQAMVSRTAEMMDDVRATIEASGEVQRHDVPQNLGLSQEPLNGTNYAKTAVDEIMLADLNRKLVALPKGFTLHRSAERVMERRAAAFNDDAPPIDWAHAELLAIASILNDGINVRLTGQDVKRGTFSQRHAVLFDEQTAKAHIPLDAVDAARFSVYNSPLSEAGPMGFEHGYSVQGESTLVIWEAQFGDFVNNAQSVIDEIVVSSHEKWGQRSNLVLLLPHGYEGQGPNHSHAHLERFLDLAASGNVRVAFPTSAAQHFHLLRTQAAFTTNGETRRPLIIMSPKSLLRHPRAASDLSEFTEGRFRPVRRFMIGANAAEDVQRLVLCTGKVFVDVASYTDALAAPVGVAVLDELYPFPAHQLRQALSAFPNATEAAWLQEEPSNRGAWEYVRSPLESVVGRRIRYVGRPRSPSPASGSNWLHRMQQEALVRVALGLDGSSIPDSD